MTSSILRGAMFAPLLLIAACGQADDPAAEFRESGAADSAGAAAEVTTADAVAGPSALELALPNIAYSFDYAFRLPGDDIGRMQQDHADICEAQGPGACRILSLSRNGSGEDATGTLELAVAADKGRALGTLISASTEAKDGEVLRADIVGEEMSKQLSDTQAQLESRIALRDRLLQVLKTRRGTVEELVAAEKEVAAVNAEIDAARSWLKETRGKVAFSRMTINYEAANPGGSFLDPIESAWGAVGWISGGVLAALMIAGAAVLPFLVLMLGVRAVQRRAAPSPQG